MKQSTTLPASEAGTEQQARSVKTMYAERVSLVLIGVLIGLVAAAAAVTAAFGGLSGVRSAVKYALVLQVIRRDFVADYDMESVTDAAMSGAISGLDDRWSYYMNAEEYAAYRDYSANRYQGIGVTVRKDEDTGGFLIVTVNKDGPAMQAGLVAGDIIVAVDGQDVTGGETADLKALIQADFGQNALVAVLREGERREFSVSCEEVYSDPVEYELLDGGTGYVMISNFREGSAQSAIDAVDELVSLGAERLVFDVRNDPGGQLTELIALLDYLLPEGEIFIRADKTGAETVEMSDADCVELPMAVLINGESYSAAEFFAAALREYDWAVLVGEPTTGKARSQITVGLSDGSAVHLSKYSYLTPDRVDLTETGGLVPDVEAALTEEELTELLSGWLEPADDPQVQTAVEVLLGTYDPDATAEPAASADSE